MHIRIGGTDNILMQRRNRWAIVITLVVILAITTYLLLRPGAAWDPANVVPDTAIFAIAVDVNSTQQKMDALKTIRGIGKSFGLENSLNLLSDDFREWTGLDMNKDILPLTNMRAIIAVTDVPSEEGLPVVIAIGAKDDDSALKLKDKFLKAYNKTGMLSEEVEFEDVPFNRLSSDRGEGYLGIVSQSVVLAFDEATAQEVAETSVSRGRSLASLPMYKKASKSDPSVAAYAYVSGEVALASLGFMLPYYDYNDESETEPANLIRCCLV